MIESGKRWLVALAAATVVLTGSVQSVSAIWVHYFDCTACHQAGALLYDLDTNLCQTCHSPAGVGSTIALRGTGGGNSNPVRGSFVGGDNSDRFDSVAPVYNAPMQTSHIFASKDKKPEAGALPAADRKMYSRYGIGKGYVYCARCHLPHDDTNNPQLLRLGVGSADAMCLDCHRTWDVSANSGLETHPIIADYNSAVTAAPTKFNASVTNVNSGGVKLVNGGVSCTSCHGVHFVDSDSTTGDGMLNSATLNPSDGTLLLSDGPSRTGATQNDTAQLRSNLCQACHTYALHGKAGSARKIGCLDCHGGHSYNGGTPSAYVLNDVTPSAVPTFVNGLATGPSIVSFPNYVVAGGSRTKWSDDVNGTANGFCEKCHGDVQDPANLGDIVVEHLEGNNNQCDACHMHEDPAQLYSFNVDASAATCGACHGFPPYLNLPGNRTDTDPAGVDGGYAYYNTANNLSNYSYANESYFKDESKTAHKTHAGAALGINPGDWYFVGAAGIENCQPCHGNDAGTAIGGHQIDPVTDPNTFRNVPFNPIATHAGAFIPVYSTVAATCNNVYCHTNGLPRTGDGPTRSLAGTHVTPPWVGTGADYASGGYGSITLNANRCADCHGNTAATMTTQGNTGVHNVHLGGPGYNTTSMPNMGITFGCDVCHVTTADSATALNPGATDGRSNGTHINSQIEVAYNTSNTNPLYNALSVNTVGPSYDMTTGTCSVYCHDPADTGNTADWDSTSSMQCDTCHGGTGSDTNADGGVGPIATGSHTRHFKDINGPKLTCAECHGVNADAGSHAGHLDGVVDLAPPVDGVSFNNICEECHGYDADPGEVLPVWGNSGTTDCATCHVGTQCGKDFTNANADFMSVITVDSSRAGGHNRPTSAGNYPQSGNVAANRACTDCHLADSATHWDAINGDLFLRTDDGFPATYAGNENAFCANCHGSLPASLNAASVATRNINTHMTKQCVGCHDIHGTANIQMVHVTQARQVAADQTATGKYAADVFFTDLTTFGTNSYDEDDGAAGGAGEANGDDICATCHTVAAGTTHNNADNSAVTHYQGSNCFTCHGTHTDTNAFKVGVGTACDDCHGFPPVTGAHARHSQSASTNKDVEDRTDCANCHTGAASYTYDLSADILAALNHSNASGRKAILAGTVGYNAINLDCATACHTSTVANGGRWTDATGLNCDACHSVTGGGNLSISHDEHLNAGKLCADCHTLVDGAAPVAGPLTHITDTSGANQGLMYQGMAVALQDEAAVVRASMTFDDPTNTCSGTGIGLGCHASGSPDWDIAIPANGCTNCHTNTDTAAYNPVSGIHDNSPAGPTVTGNSHDGSFDDGAAGTADCVTCHSTSPTVVVANHINGTLNSGTAITVQAVAGYSQATGTCATTCHSAGTVWNYKWSTTAYNSTGAECANCHGDYASGWNAGVAPHSEIATRGTKHNNVGTLTYPCSDCHAIGSAGYNWTSKWDPTGLNSNHGDDKITMNQVAGTNTFTIDTVPNPDRAGCTTATCHNQGGISADTSHTFPVSSTTFLTQTVTGNAPSVSCSGCHGGTVGTNANGYWPDGANTAGDNLVEDNSGAHLKHIVVLAQQVYGETIALLLTDNTAGNPGLTSDVKQKELCSYCHNTPGSDADHGVVANLPAEVNGMYTMWTKAVDNGVYNAVGNGTCATVDCHFNKTTPVANEWYDAPGNSVCLMCHVDVTAEAKHTAHTGAATNFGRAIGCADCHDAATNWATNTPPASGHLNNTYSISGGVVFTYSLNSCGTNACHNAGDGVSVPATNPYPWNGGALANCTICHAGTPATGAHAVHVANGSYVVNSCDNCHTAATAATHINTSVTYNTAEISAAPGNGSCTNTCHLAGDAGDWTGGTAALACTDCHSGSYIGSGTNGPQFGMHTVTPTVSGKVHTATGLGTTCDTCHVSMPAPGGTHVNGILLPDGGATPNTDRGMFAGFTDGATPTCTTACHMAGVNWTYKWSATAANSNGTECANCHGDYASGWNAGVGHATNPTRGNSSNHNDTGVLTYACTACHVIGATTGNYPWTSGANDYNSTDVGATTLHGDGVINMNNNTAVHTRSGTAGCTGCHAANDGIHDFPISSWTPANVTGDTPAAGGGCDGCHGNQAGNFWPDGNTTGASIPTADDQAGKHPQHMAALMAKGIAQADACGYCHGPEPGSGTYHNNGTATLPQHSAGAWFYKRIIGGANDTDGVFSAVTNSCSNIDCHFNNAVTPHWYDDTVAPAQVTLTAVAGPVPRSIKVSWTAPGDDNNLANTTPYVYDLRIGASAAEAQNFGLTTNYAGNLPAAYAQGFTSEAVIQNLNVGTTYYFSLKTRDTVGNWSTASAAVSALPAVDTIAPEFGGADKAVKGDEGTAINLYWTAAEDHTMPITYKIWLKNESAGALDMGSDVPIITGWTDTKIELDASHGIVDDNIFHMGVRACDANNNCDTNTQTVSATPTAPPEVDKSYHTYVTNGSLTLVKDGTPGTTASTTTFPAVFAGPSLAYPVRYFADTFAVYVDTGNSAGTITATLGYSTNGTNFTSLGVAKTVNHGARSDRVYQFKLVDVLGKEIAAGQRIAIEITHSGFVNGLSYGTATNRGDLTVAERVVNQAPTPAANNGTALTGAIVDIQWTAALDIADGVTDVVHYDLYGSKNGGATYNHVIAEGLNSATLSYQWDTQTAGITSGALAVRINAGDGYTHTTTDITALGTADATDYIAPSAVTDLVAKTRPKAGSVQLIWTAPGDDYGNHGRAAYYDIRYSTSAITDDTSFNAAAQAVNEPSPDFGGRIQKFEVTGLLPDTSYNFAMKTYDEQGNGSPLSNVVVTNGGPRCGMCHTTAPSVTESVGNHKLHGFTINDCTNCHGAAVASYTLAHQDGLLTMGYGPGGPVVGVISTTYNANDTITYTDTVTAKVMYRDTNGYGGFGSGNYLPAGDGIDNGTCMNFGAMGVGGCHGPAGTDPDGAGPLPTYATPNWNQAASLDCAQCHGNPARTTDSSYGRVFDGTTANGGIVPDQILGAPLVDNHGNYDPAAATVAERKYIGQHEKHLNYSFRFSKGDSCNLCHAGDYADRNDLDGRHANGAVDVKLDLNAAGNNAVWSPGIATTAGTCSSMSPETCHPGYSAPTWDSASSFDCVGCHNMGGVLDGSGPVGNPVGHYTDPFGGITLDTDTTNTNDGGPMLGNCTWCHFAGHPRDDVGGAALILANSSQVGINYKSGGIHLRKSIGGRAPAASEAQLCWGCHDSQATPISEWGTDTNANNTSTAPSNASDYDYGSVSTSNWTTATWYSANNVALGFAYKSGAIQSTHSTNELGTSAVTNTTGIGTYSENPDAVGNIRCSNCHDVHNLNKAPGDNMTGNPYLRGTWIRNPYPEDGAPWNKNYTVVVANYGAVPRAFGNEAGGYQIDQNNSSPTAGLSVATSGGLCLLCHGSVGVDNMDKTADAGGLWVGAGGNGHSNAALGGTGLNASNIFGDGIGGRPVPNASAGDGSPSSADIYNMGLQTVNDYGSPYGYGYRSLQNGTGKYTPPIIDKSKPYSTDFKWGVSMNSGTPDIGYHAFTCSKCHNPHASRLPKLMITNCLDTSHNTWDNAMGKQQTFWTSGNGDVGEWTATHNTAQNCHRLDPNGHNNAGGYLGGWNKVTPW